MFASRLPEAYQDFGLACGLAMLLVALCMGVMHLWRWWRAQRAGIPGLKPAQEPRKEGPATLLVPDWPIRDLCYHLRPDVHPNGPTSVWDELSLELFDKLSVGQLAIWGRELRRDAATTYGPLEPIPKEYWRTAHLTFVFLLEDREKDRHVDRGPKEPAYGDLQVNRAQAIAIWPQALG
jgi:hypothetical protein